VADPGRDQTKTLEAVKAFTQVLEKSPKGPYSPIATIKIAELRNRLAEHEKRVVSHYLGRKHYASAEARALRALSEYPETAAVPSLLSSLAEALEKQGKKPEAAEIRKSLAEKFPAPEGKKP
jgi:outer membrane protein assembly factor BamD